MEAKESIGTGGGVTIVSSDAPTNYQIAPRSETTTQVAGATPAPPQLPPVAGAQVGEFGGVKKKRGRPRKYGPDGSVARVLSPKPISSSAPPPAVIDFAAEKRPKMKTVGSLIRQPQPKYEAVNLGELPVPTSVGANFTPHIITVNAGEDVTMKVISFSQQGPRAICVLSANGVISSVTLRQPDSSGGTLTYEGRFEILSLTGSFTPSESGGIRNRSGGMSVSLASPDGRVVGGGVAGLLVAAGPVQIVVGSFLTGNQHEQKPKKQKSENISFTTTPTTPTANIGAQDGCGGQGHRVSSTSNVNLQSSFHGDHRSSSMASDGQDHSARKNGSL